jgi:hypothetical protein
MFDIGKHIHTPISRMLIFWFDGSRLMADLGFQPHTKLLKKQLEKEQPKE